MWTDEEIETREEALGGFVRARSRLMQAAG